MLFLNKILFHVGIGGVKVDFQLRHGEWIAGSQVDGLLIFQGGKFEQRLESCDISLYAEYTRYYTNAQGEHRSSSEKALINSYTIPCQLQLQPSEYKELPASLLLPLHTPAKFFREKVWFETRLNNDQKIKSKDKDIITVLPDPLLKRVLNSMDRLGFTLFKSFMVNNADDQLSPDTFVQQIVYSVSSDYQVSLDEIIMIPVWMEHELRVTLQINTKKGLAKTLTGKDIISETIILEPDEWSTKNDEQLTKLIQETIERNI